MRNVRTLPQLLFLVFVRPVFPALQWLGRASGLFTEAKTVEGPYRRQPYLIGHLKAGVGPHEVAARLSTCGFFLERIAYPDPGQTLSMRRLDDERPDEQYHLRIFADGEVRGHQEYTPEDHPVKHIQETLFAERNALFTDWLGDLLA